jgi:hypothetical protein
MKPLPDVFAVQHVGDDRWLAVAPSQRTLARTYERTELRAVDCAKKNRLISGLFRRHQPKKPPRRRDYSEMAGQVGSEKITHHSRAEAVDHENFRDGSLPMSGRTAKQNCAA